MDEFSLELRVRECNLICGSYTQPSYYHLWHDRIQLAYGSGKVPVSKSWPRNAIFIHLHRSVSITLHRCVGEVLFKLLFAAIPNRQRVHNRSKYAECLQKKPNSSPETDGAHRNSLRETAPVTQSINSPTCIHCLPVLSQEPDVRLIAPSPRYNRDAVAFHLLHPQLLQEW